MLTRNFRGSLESQRNVLKSMFIAICTTYFTNTHVHFLKTKKKRA